MFVLQTRRSNNKICYLSSPNKPPFPEVVSTLIGAGFLVLSSQELLFAYNFSRFFFLALLRSLQPTTEECPTRHCPEECLTRHSPRSFLPGIVRGIFLPGIARGIFLPGIARGIFLPGIARGIFLPGIARGIFLPCIARGVSHQAET